MKKEEKVDGACDVVFPAYSLELIEFGFWNTRNSCFSADFLLRVKKKPTESWDFIYQNTVLI